MSSLSQRKSGRPGGSGRSPVVAALDIGSSKIACLIARRADSSDGEPRICGAGTHATKGVKAGAAVDMEALERSIRLAVEQAERAAETRISEVVLGISGPDLKSDVVKAKLPLNGREVTAQHCRDAKFAALDSFSATGREVLHAAPLGYALDGATGVKDPRGMFAGTLTASYLVVSAPSPGLRNLVQCVARAHLQVSQIAAAPYASGLAVLVEDEAEHGATVIDMGGGVTSAAAFSDGGLLHVESIPMGGARATLDLQHGLGTTFAAAERLKTLHGAVGLTEMDALEMVEAPRLGPDGRLESYQRTRAELAQVLRPRYEELFELMDMRLSKASAAGRPLPRRIVLTGGGCLLPSIRELAEDIFRAPVRIALPANVRGLGETFSSPAFAAAAGLLRWEMLGAPDATRMDAGHGGGDSGAGLFRRVASWVQENF